MSKFGRVVPWQLWETKGPGSIYPYFIRGTVYRGDGTDVLYSMVWRPWEELRMSIVEFTTTHRLVQDRHDDGTIVQEGKIGPSHHQWQAECAVNYIWCASRSPQFYPNAADYLNTPKIGIVNKIRDHVTAVRSEISSLLFAYPSLKDSMENVEGTLTLAVVYMYHEIEQLKKREEARERDTNN